MTQSINTSIPVFNHPEFGDLEIIFVDDKPYFPATDCARILGYTNPEKAVRDHCKGVNETFTPSNGGIQKKNFIPEGDLYRLIIRSKLPAAEKFELWVFDDLLPTLRRTGSYSMHEQPQLDTPSTKADREPLTNLVNSLVSVAPLSYRDVWHMVKAELKTTKKAAEFTVAEVADALKFVQSKIDLYCTHDDIITEQALKGTKAFIVRISVEEPTKSKSMTLIQRQFKATVYITEEKAPHEISTRISHMLYVHHDK